MPSVYSQESLGDVARKLREQKKDPQSAVVNSSPTISPTTPAAKTDGLQQSPPITIRAATASGMPTMPDLNPNVSTDVHGIEKFEAGVLELFQQEKFAEIERIANEARSTKARFPGGFWKIHLVYTGLFAPLKGTKVNASVWPEYLARVQRWISQYPNSITARVTLAWFYNFYGWNARGGGFANTVTDEGWRLLAERAAMGRKVLEEAQSLPTKCPEWFLVMMSFARAEDWDEGQKKALFEQAVAFDPDYYYYYRTQAESLLPKWGGEKGDVAAFAGAMADRIGGPKGDFLYYSIATFIVCACDNEDHLNGMSWPRLKRGFDAADELFGKSIYQSNKMAFLAYMANDLEYAIPLFAQIGENWDVETWREHDDFLDAKRRANASIVLRYYAEATENAKKPEGQAFTLALSAALTNNYHEKLMDCMKTTTEVDRRDVGVLLQLAKDGSVQQVILAPYDAPIACFRPQLEKAVFPTPPSANYWAVVTMSAKK